MSGFLAQARASLVAALAGCGLTVMPGLPERINPPCIVIEPGDPWIEPDQVAGWHTVRLDVTVIVPQAPNLTALDDLDTRVAAVIRHMEDSSEWDFDSVDPPRMLPSNGTAFLSCSITFTTTTGD